MALATETWKKHTHQSMAAFTAADYHVLEHGRHTAAAYYDTATRTAGAGSATKNATLRATNEACDWEFADTNLAALKMMTAGQAGAGPAPLMATPNADTIVAGEVNIGLAKSAGAYVDWESATNPYDAGSPLGLTRWWDGLGTAPFSVHMYESQGMSFRTVTPTVGETRWALGGATIDPDSTHASNAETAAAYDGYLFSVANGGVTGTAGALWSTVGGTTGVFNHNTTNGGAHHRMFVPGTGTGEAQRRSALQVSATANVKVNGDYVATPIFIERTSDAKWRGRLREIFYAPGGVAQSGQVLRISGVDVAYYEGAIGTADGIFLRTAP